MPPFGCVNVHASLLPRWRGAAPVQRAIMAGDAETGISIMRIGRGVDTGAYCAQAACSVADKTSDELGAELAEMGGRLLVETLPSIAKGCVEWVEQDETLVTHAPKISKEEMLLDPSGTVIDNYRRVLASSDAAPARCSVAAHPVRIMRASPISASEVLSLMEGSCAVRKGRLLLGCSDGVLGVSSLKPDGKREMDVAAWHAGQRGDVRIWDSLRS